MGTDGVDAARTAREVANRFMADPQGPFVLHWIREHREAFLDGLAALITAERDSAWRRGFAAGAARQREDGAYLLGAKAARRRVDDGHKTSMSATVLVIEDCCRTVNSMPLVEPPAEGEQEAK